MKEQGVPSVTVRYEKKERDQHTCRRPPPAPTPQNPNPPRHPTAIAGSFKVLVADQANSRDCTSVLL